MYCIQFIFCIACCNVYRQIYNILLSTYIYQLIYYIIFYVLPLAIYYVVKRFIPFVAMCLYFFYLTFYVKHNINISGCYREKEKLLPPRYIFFWFNFTSVLLQLVFFLAYTIHSSFCFFFLHTDLRIGFGAILLS